MSSNDGSAKEDLQCGCWTLERIQHFNELNHQPAHLIKVEPYPSIKFRYKTPNKTIKQSS